MQNIQNKVNEAPGAAIGGLSSAQAVDAMRRGLSNFHIDNTQKTTKDIVRENLFTYFNLIFLVLTILLLIAGAFTDLTFLPVIIANTLIGIFQQLRAKKVLDRLSVMNQATAQVMRDGTEYRIGTDNLVLNDIIVLRGGSQIPADAVVVSGEVSVNEALLTGEADEISKGPGSKLMSGSFVISGQCFARLTKVGADSYISRLTLKAKKMKAGEQSAMIRDINHIILTAGIAILPIGGILLYQSLSKGQPFQSSVSSMVAAVIGMIPEGLYLLVSITLAISAMRLAREKVMLHDMRSIETLARVDVLCIDKTGTITDNSMLVADAVLPVPANQMQEDSPAPGDPQKEESSNQEKDRIFQERSILLGDYLNCLSDNNITMEALRAYFNLSIGRRCSVASPFTSKLKYSSVTFPDATYALGAPEILLRADYDKWEPQVSSYAGKGLRVLAFCRIGTADPLDGSQNILSAEPLLFIMLQNPIREGAAETFSYFESQGVEIKVISGDNPLTVSEVAKRAGISNAKAYCDAQTLKTDADIQKAVSRFTVFGRVTPDQKRKLVRALKDAGRTVAMTGDGVNDILAMKDADCSIAMAAGSDAAVQAAQVALLDSDFSHMKEIVSEGRRDINNIERSATLFLVKNIFSLFLSIFSIINVLQYPLEPSQISLISAFNIGIPAFCLAVEPNNKKAGGNFLLRVLFKAMPAALTDFLAIAALVVFGNVFHVAVEDVSVAATFLLAIVGFMILFRISAPFNRYRAIIISACMVGFVFCAYFFRDLFAITSVSLECVMLFVLFAIATEPFMRYLTMLFDKIPRK